MFSGDFPSISTLPQRFLSPEPLIWKRKSPPLFRSPFTAVSFLNNQKQFIKPWRIRCTAYPLHIPFTSNCQFFASFVSIQIVTGLFLAKRRTQRLAPLSVSSIQAEKSMLDKASAVVWWPETRQEPALWMLLFQIHQRPAVRDTTAYRLTREWMARLACHNAQHSHLSGKMPFALNLQGNHQTSIASSNMIQERRRGTLSECS